MGLSRTFVIASGPEKSRHLKTDLSDSPPRVKKLFVFFFGAIGVTSQHRYRIIKWTVTDGEERGSEEKYEAAFHLVSTHPVETQQSLQIIGQLLNMNINSYVYCFCLIEIVFLNDK